MYSGRTLLKPSMSAMLEMAYGYTAHESQMSVCLERPNALLTALACARNRNNRGSVYESAQFHALHAEHSYTQLLNLPKATKIHRLRSRQAEAR